MLVRRLPIVFMFGWTLCQSGQASIDAAPRLADHVGKTVAIDARTTREIAAHVIAPPDPFGGWKVNYVIYDDVQIVVYSKTSIECAGVVRITGRVREVASGRDPRAKSYHGYQVDAEAWECKK